MQITLPDDPRYQATAAAAGFANVEEYVRAMLRDEAGKQVDEAHPNHKQSPHEGWEQKLMKYRSRLRPGNPDFDDSRESIYPGRD